MVTNRGCFRLAIGMMLMGVLVLVSAIEFSNRDKTGTTGPLPERATKKTLEKGEDLQGNNAYSINDRPRSGRRSGR